MDNNNEFIHEDEQQPNDSETTQSRTVSPMRGFFWLERSLSEVYVPYFKSWFVASLIYTFITSILPAFVPMTAIIIALAKPLLLAGLLIGAHLVYTQQTSIKPLQMFEAFKSPRVGQVLLYILSAFILAMVLAFILISIVGSETFSGIDLQRIESGDQLYLQSVLKQLAPAIPWGALLIIMLSLATWFAVSLILFSGQDAFPAIGNSFIGGLKNFFAVLVLVIVGFVCLLALTFISGLLLTMLGNLATNPYFNMIFTIITGALMVPIGVGVTYIAYREIFLGDIKKSENSL